MTNDDAQVELQQSGVEEECIRVDLLPVPPNSILIGVTALHTPVLAALHLCPLRVVEIDLRPGGIVALGKGPCTVTR